MKEVGEITGSDIGLKAVRGKLLTVKEIAKFMRVSKRWVQKHMANGTFPIRWYLVAERDRVVDSVDLDDWLRKVVISPGMATLPEKAARRIKEEECA